MILADFWSFFSDYGRLVLVMAFLIPIIAVLGYFWHQIETVRSNNALKQSMLERGKSVEEIERVLAAGAEKHRKDDK